MVNVNQDWEDEPTENNGENSAKPNAAPARVWSAYQLALFRDIAEGRGHTFVSAVAGSGKSSSMEEGLTHVPHGLTVLVCPFNKEIDLAFKPRLVNIAPRLQKNVKAESSTLHSYGKRQLMRAFGRHELNGDKTWMLMDEMLSGEKLNKKLKVSLSQVVSLSKGTLARSAQDIQELVFNFGVDIVCDDEAELDEQEYSQQLSWFVSTVEKLLARSKSL